MPAAQNSPSPPTSGKTAPANQASPSGQAKPAMPLPSPSSPSPQPSPSSSPPTAKTSSPLPPAPVRSSPFRFVVPLIIAALLIFVAIFAVTRILPLIRGGQAEVKPVEITYWGLWEPSSVIADIIADFETQNPTIKVTYQQQSHRDYRDRLYNSILDGTGPDLFRFHHTWVPMLPDILDTVPSDIITSSAYEQTFYPVANDWLRSQSGLVGVPLMFDGLGLYYNRDILSAAGKSPPTSWDELRRTASQLTVRQDNTILRGGVALGTTNNVDHWSDILGLLLLQNSASPQRPNNTYGQDALTFYTLFTKVDRVWDQTMPESTIAFADEKVAMMIAPSWRAHDVAHYNPNLNFAIAPVPQLTDSQNITWASFWAEGVSQKSSPDKRNAAWKFIAHMAQKETLRQFYQAASSHPGRLFGEPFSRVDLAPQLENDPYVGAFIAQAPYAQSWFLASYTWDNGLNDLIINYYQDAVNAILTGQDPARALSVTEQGISQVMSQFRLR